ncbi:MAG: hypothetical protein NC223_12095 [Butyrivibrio sp.]|nr:hypothetical protein [Butyrivibrio sp.]
MNLMYKLERKFGRYSIKNLSLILIICYAAGYIMEFINPDFLYWITLDPYAIAHGQAWRIVSWILIPPPESNIFFALIMLVFYYSIGTTLERTWGSFQYNVYLFSGMIFTVLGSFLMMGFTYLFKPGLLNISGGGAAVYFRIVSSMFSTYYVNMSIFLAYAATFPDNQVLLMFFIPIKVKWLGIVYGAFLVYEIVAGLRSPYVGYIYPFAIGSSLMNFIVFFFTTRNYIRMNKAQRKKHREFKQNAKRAQREAYSSSVSKHRCAVCGRTEKDGDDLQFRFCSKCEGGYEFCQDHLYTHIHFTKDNKDQ